MLLLAAASARAGGLSHKLYAFDNGTGRDEKVPYDEQASLVARTGYDGLAMFTGTARIPEMLAALEAHKLPPMLGIYVHSFADGRPDPIDPGLPQAIHDLTGHDTMIVLTVQGHAADSEQRAVDNIRRVADLAAAANLRVCLYPHVNFYMETAADALRLIRKAARPNVGLTLNLYHAVAFHLSRCGSADFDMAALIQAALPHLYLVSINGITRPPVASDNLPGLDRLDRGDYDIRHFLSLLDKAGYTGPIGLQCYSVPGDREENLTRSLAAFQKMVADLH